MTFLDTDGTPQAGLRVYAFTDSVYSGCSGTTDASGNVTFSLPLGEYRFRADQDGVQFWSSAVNACHVPDCESASVTLPCRTGELNATIAYEYDPLNRVVKARRVSNDLSLASGSGCFKSCRYPSKI